MPKYIINRSADDLLREIKVYFPIEQFTVKDLARATGGKSQTFSAMLKQLHKKGNIKYEGKTRIKDNTGNAQSLSVWKLSEVIK